MKKLILLAGLVSIVAASCSKDDDDKTTTPATNTNNVAGKWKMTIYDNATVTAPDSGSYEGVATSATEGTYHFELHYGSSRIEDGGYTLSANNTNIIFTNNAGNQGILYGGGTWTINTLNATTFRMTSGSGLVIEYKK